MTMFQIKDRFTGAVQFECELPAEVSSEHVNIQLGFAIKAALNANANLRGANLSDADLNSFKQDLIAEVLRVPGEIEGLRQALLEGRIDGSTYSGECACLAGTVANLKGIEDYNGADINVTDKITFAANSSSPRERWFMGIREGDTPETNRMAEIALDWIDEAIAIRDNIRATVKATP
jgi:hypothetical protein